MGTFKTSTPDTSRAAPQKPLVYENLMKQKQTSQNSDSVQKKFIAEAMDAHNEFRRKHDVPPVEHNPDLSKIAETWAINIASRNVLEHSKSLYNGEKLGENVAMMSRTGASHYDGYEATKEWYNEIEKYKFDKGGFIPGIKT